MKCRFEFGTKDKRATIDPIEAALFGLRLEKPDHARLFVPGMRKLCVVDGKDFPLLLENRGWLPTEIDVEPNPCHDTKPNEPRRGVAFFRLSKVGREEILRVRRERAEELRQEIEEIARNVTFRAEDGAACRDGRWETPEEALSLLYSARPWERAHYTMLLRYLLKMKPGDAGLRKHAEIIFSELGMMGQGPYWDPILRGNPTREEVSAFIEATAPQYPPEAADFVFDSYRIHPKIRSMTFSR